MQPFGPLLASWCSLIPEARAVIVTDAVQQPLAKRIAAEMDRPCAVRLYEPDDALRDTLSALQPEDLVTVLLSLHTAADLTRPRWFSPFAKPDWLRAKCAFIRLSIGEASLREGLSTPKDDVYAMIAARDALVPGERLRITAPGGTDITLRTGPFTTCTHEITAPGGIAFLPPSETSSDVLPGTACGCIVADITLGQVHRFAAELGRFGLVDAPAAIQVQNGLITQIHGSPMAQAFRDLLFSLPEDARTLVELGQGLSRMTPTGLIGVDESILSTCHFGFGHHMNGTHTDVVIRTPYIERSPVP